ncbi:MAG: translation initiation factor IF-2 [Gammaproteobacteria bacterium]|nr:translation initiation factor IF-2 [Gammaproteobacteria bacterium]
MAEVTVAQFAEVLKVPVERLLTQLDEAGLKVSGAEDKISDDAKMELLTYLRRSHGKKEAASAGPGKITLKRKQQSELRMPGGQGRARTVNVEVRRKRTYVKRDVLEKKAEEQRLELEKKREAEAALRKEEEQKLEMQRKEQDDARRVAEELEAKEKADEAARRLAEQEKADRERKRREEQARREKKEAKAKPTRYGRKELHVASGKSGQRRVKKPRRRRSVQVSGDSQHGFERPTAPVVREVAIPEALTVGELAQRLAIKAPEVIRTLMNMGVITTINQSLDQDTATLVVEELGHIPKLVSETEIEDKLIEAQVVEGEENARAPVVTIMGHVDHGKTSLLDYIRRTRVTEGEAGGITQHIGAYHVETDKGVITFLDTPGHEAFTSMRARGAQVTDIVILVVAADDGVKPQTEEAVKHARAAGVPLVVAVNKTDLEAADPERVKNELSAMEVIPEAWGGDVMFVNVSAKTGDGIPELLDAVLLQAEVLELKAVDAGPAAGVVIESSLEKGRGAVATLLVSRGTLAAGDFILAGKEVGRIRAMFDESGKEVDKAGPSMPVVVLGLSGTPNAGDEMLVVENERKAREVAELRQGRQRDVKLALQQSAKLDDVFSQMREGEKHSVNLLIKADVQGSAEALSQSLSQLSHDEVEVKVISSGVGGITESDVNLAAASSAVLVGFNVRADAAARAAIKDTGVDLHYYSVIYEAIDEVKKAISGLLSPEIREQIVGLAEVREVFRSPKFGQVAGCMVADGFVRRSLPVRVLRENVVIFEGELDSLRRFKDDVNEVRAGTECGIGVRNYNDIKVGDQIECFERKEFARTV